MLSKIGGAALAVALMMTTAASAREYEVVMRNDIVFAEHEGTKLLGDLYAPKGLEKAPVRMRTVPVTRRGVKPMSTYPHLA